MARKPRVDVEGGLYHVIARGNNRRGIFDAPDEYLKFLSLLAVQAKPPPGPMPNHVVFQSSGSSHGGREAHHDKVGEADE